MNFTPCSASGEAIADFLLSSVSSAPPASHTNGITWWTRSNAFLPGEPNGWIGLPSISLTGLTFSSVARNASQSVKAVASSTPAFFERVLAVVDGAGLREPRQRPRPVTADDLRRLPHALGVGGLAADVLGALVDVLEAAERGEERHLRRARLRDVRALARDGRVADAVELHVPADDLGVDLDARLLA